jgi:MFS family permease
MTSKIRFGFPSLRVLKNRDFSTLWFGNLLSNIGTWMQQVAEPWLVLSLSNSPILLGVDSFLTDAPIWLLILWGGVLADRRDRKKLILWLQGLQTLCPLLIVLLLLIGKIQVGIVILLSFVVGVTDALSGPAIQSLIPSVVPRGDIGDAIALNSAQFNLSRVLGPFFAGVVMASLGAIGCFGVNVLSYIPFLLAIFLVRLPKRDPVPAEGDSLAEVARSVADRPELRMLLLTVVGTSVLVAPVVTFLPVLVRDVFHRGAAGFGGALSFFGFGGLMGAAVVLYARDNPSRRKVSSWAAAAIGGLLIAVALSPSFELAILCVLLIGMGMVASNTAANSLLQSSIESRFRGRISSLYTLGMRGGMPLGNLITGGVVSHFGVRRALLANGILALAFQASLLAVPSRKRGGTR